MPARAAPTAGVQGSFPRGGDRGRNPDVSTADLIEGLTMAAYFLAGFLTMRAIIRAFEMRDRFRA